MTEVSAQLEGSIYPLLSSPLLSSDGLGWKGLVIEGHSVLPKELQEVPAVHLIVEFTLGKHAFYGERPDWRGRFRPFSKPPGAINLFSNGIRPALRSFTRTELIVCGLDPEFVSEVAAELNFKTLRDQIGIRDESLGALMRLLEIEVKSGEQSNSLYVDSLAYALTVRLFSPGNQGQGSRFPRQVLPSQNLRRVVERMKTDLCADLDLKTLAAESGYSRNHFLRMFRIATDCTPHRYFLRLRVESARSMMKNRSLRMIDISEACGFASPSQFSRVFRLVQGVTPSEYRRDILRKNVDDFSPNIGS